MFEEMDRIDAENSLKKGLTNLAKRQGAPEQANCQYIPDKLLALMDLVLERNEIINLTSITEPVEFVQLHLLDSLACVGLPELNRAKNIIDVGTGAGFPGLPLAILYPEKQFYLTDSLKKRIEFIEYATEKLELKNVIAKQMRAETAGHDKNMREQFDLSLCRAVGNLSIVLEYCMPLVNNGGSGIFYKTVSAEGEIGESLMARRMLGCADHVRIETYTDILPGREHALYIIEKTKPTPAKYPRREGVPSKVPL